MRVIVYLCFCGRHGRLGSSRRPFEIRNDVRYSPLLTNDLPVNIIHRIRERIFGCQGQTLSEGSTRAERGQFGEDLAADYCRRTLGYRLLVRNWRCKRDEVDLICRDGEVLVFVEVRARAESALVSGFHSVGRHKKQVLQRAYKNYLKQLQNPPKHFRFDIIDVAISNKGEGKVRHYANIPLFSKHYTAQKPLSYD